jgi:amino acid permease
MFSLPQKACTESALMDPPLEGGTENEALIDSIDSDYAVVDSHGQKASLHSASLPSSIVNLSNTILGAGMLGLPHAFSKCGYVLGLLLLTFAGVCSAFGLFLLSVSAKQVGGNSSFYKITAATLPRFAFLVDVAIAIKCFGVATSYLVVVGDMMPGALNPGQPNEYLDSRYFWISALTLTIVVPLSFLKVITQIFLLS